MKKVKEKKGFIALVLTISISGILLALVSASSIDSASFFDQAMRKKYRAMNYYYAYDCIDQAILNLAHDYFYSVDIPQEIPEYYCTILSVKKEGEVYVIKTRGDLQKAYVYREARVKVLDDRIEVIEVK